MRLNSARLRQGFRDKFAADLRLTFLPDLGGLDAIAGQQAVLAFFRQTMSMSEAAGFALQGEIIKFSFVALHLGLFFDRDPLLDQVRAGALWDHQGVHPNVGLNRMFDNADLMIAERLAGADQGFAPGFHEACAACEAPPQGKPLAAARVICASANPARAHALGDTALDAALTAGWRDLEDNHPRFRDHPLEWMICSYFLGHGFARNPLYAWMAWDIAKGGLPAIRRRLDE